MTNLTEQWKKGELPAGYYYVKNEFGNIFPTDYSEEYDYISDVVIKDFFMEASEIVEIIDKVPSYEEYVKLKELLKECRKILDYAKDFAYHNPCCKCIEKINQALGEDK